MNIQDLKIGARMSLGFILVITLMVMLGVYTQVKINELSGLTDKMYKHPFAVSTAMLRINGNIIKMHRSMKDVALAKSVEQMDEAAAVVLNEEQQVLNDFKIVEERYLGNKTKVIEARDLFLDWKPIRNQVIEYMRRGERDQAAEITKDKGAKHVNKLMDVSNYLIESSYETADTFISSAHEMKNSAINVTYALILLSIVVAAIIAWFFTRSVVRPIKQALGLAGKVAAGDLTRNIRVERKDEAGELFQALKDMNGNLHQIVLSVKENANYISNGAQQITLGNMDLSQRTEEQASSLEETASSMEQMTTTVKMNAESAQQANQLSMAARDEAEKGGAVVERAINAMGEISSSSSKISDIISTIDSIAFQTNLLALNAAVEAARAGEQGRGFAVVANEVRTLAQRSAEAAKEIKILIQDSVDKVKIGTKLVDDSGNTLKGIVEGIKKVSDIVAEINIASQEQASGIDQVNKAINQMDDMTQQNAALVEESAAASRSMEDQANKLNELMGFFKVNQNNGVKNVASSRHAGVEHTSARPAISQEKPNIKTSKAAADLSEEWQDF